MDDADLVRQRILSEPGFQEGGGYDLYMRTLAQFMPAHIPGNPTGLTVNMPGAGGIKAAEYIATVAPKDGTLLSIISQGLPLYQAMSAIETANWPTTRLLRSRPLPRPTGPLSSVQFSLVATAR